MSNNFNQTLIDSELAITVSEGLILTSLFHWALCGILTVQIFLYHKTFPRDRLFIRIISYLIYAMELSQTALVARKVYLECGKGFGDPDSLLHSRMDGADAAFVAKTGLVGLLCQCFSAWRIWVLSRSKPMVASVVILSLLSTIATFVGGAQMIHVDFGGSHLPKEISTTVWALSSALCNTVIAAFMYLILKRSKTNVPKGTRSLINQILWLIVTTGTLTALMAFSALGLLVAFGNADLYLPVIFLIGKVEANSYFAVLNSRVRLSSGAHDSNVPYYADHEVVSGRFGVSLGSTGSTARRSTLQLQVHVQRRVELTPPPMSYHERDSDDGGVADDGKKDGSALEA
ncbi:hypothetical protein L218DRAFT_938443 [Marasmius fiardii PR-910]|nr:hypothetical protein L218DRAFT_938443 [Marasmius fiardii PR-910]